MSWSVSSQGTKEYVKKTVREQAQSPLKTYEGKPEAGDVAAALERLDALVDAIDLSGEYDCVKASAYGSHLSSSEGIVEGSFSIHVIAVKTDK
jgi:hypothetical protein